MKSENASSHRPHAFGGVLLGLALANLTGCFGAAKGPIAPNPEQVGDRAVSAHESNWIGNHGTVVKEADNDYSKAKWSGMACIQCHTGGADGKPAGAAGPPSCWSCHAGGPSGSPGHPATFVNPLVPEFHGAIVREAGYDYTKAKVGPLACSACHAGESPNQVSPNSRAPSCFPCHAGGPTGSAGHPVGWASLRGGQAGLYSGVPTCAGCHGSAYGPIETGDLSVTIKIGRAAWPSPSPSTQP